MIDDLGLSGFSYARYVEKNILPKFVELYMGMSCHATQSFEIQTCSVT